ncbi:ATP-binding protein [Planococcus shenhongbingii]|uniref:histidine kinase n=1 Tax=Planococcus shenhongbingii TaxID=3058398 RepID=A0ABT8N918_9BACL|nr:MULTISPECIES: ATP-binding protein [unclassified Planococcus (in: firmicutes)]MDN7244366.1 ATP-binding protein [Planococcus sp. N017]WKA57533.1 ATP-binding protein [Planococcus sp. N016]
MDRSTNNQRRNKLFIHIFGSASILHSLLPAAVNFHTALYSPIFGIISYIILLILQYKKINERIIQILVLLLMNFYVFILNFESFSAITVIYFVIPIIASALYYDTLPIIFLGVLTAVETLLLALVFDELSARASLSYIHLSLFVFIMVVLILTILHSIYFSRIWSQLEQKNESMEKALISKDGYLQLFFETAKDAIAVFDSNNKIIAINPAFEELYGWTSEECIGQSLDLVPPERIEEANMRTFQVQQGESFSLLETVDIKKDGSLFHAQITLSPITDEFGNVVATSVISRDISYQKEAEKLIVQAEKLKLAGEIAAGVAHEIRNPMTVISGFVQMMQEDPSYPYKDYTKLIHSELERINLIIGEFLVLAKPQASAPKKISLRQTMDDIIVLFGPQLNSHGILLTNHWQKDDFFILGEDHRLKQVLINLLKNSVEAIGQHGQITISVENFDDGFVSLRLRDNGSGISREVLLKIFEPFYTTKSEGTGLGLIISQKIIRELGGSLEIESEEGIGTTATVLLPKA